VNWSVGREEFIFEKGFVLVGSITALQCDADVFGMRI